MKKNYGVSSLPKETKGIIYKKIYAKRYGMNQNIFEKIINLEIQEYLKKHTDLRFDKVGEAVKGEDRSITYPIYFVKTDQPSNP
jgi:hypothetical protein